MNDVAGLLELFGVSVLLLVLAALLLVPGWGIETAAERGDTDEALRRIGSLPFWFTSGYRSVMRGRVLELAGRTLEAEAEAKRGWPGLRPGVAGYVAGLGRVFVLGAESVLLLLIPYAAGLAFLTGNALIFGRHAPRALALEVGALLVPVTLLFLVLWAPFFLVEGDLKGRRYERAERTSQLMMRLYRGITAVRYLRNEVLFEAGRFAEAEAALRETLRRNPREAVIRSMLAQLLAVQGRYDDSRAVLPPRAELKQASAVRAAECALLEGVNADAALELLRRGDDAPALLNALNRAWDPNYYAVLHADRAWAYALLGNTVDAERELAEARQTVKPRAWGYASYCYRVGRANAALGARDAAGVAYSKAIKADPRGLWGKEAEKALSAGV